MADYATSWPCLDGMINAKTSDGLKDMMILWMALPFTHEKKAIELVIALYLSESKLKLIPKYYGTTQEKFAEKAMTDIKALGYEMTDEVPYEKMAIILDEGMTAMFNDLLVNSKPRAVLDQSIARESLWNKTVRIESFGVGYAKRLITLEKEIYTDFVNNLGKTTIVTPAEIVNAKQVKQEYVIRLAEMERELKEIQGGEEGKITVKKEPEKGGRTIEINIFDAAKVPEHTKCLAIRHPNGFDSDLYTTYVFDFGGISTSYFDDSGSKFVIEHYDAEWDGEQALEELTEEAKMYREEIDINPKDVESIFDSGTSRKQMIAEIAEMAFNWHFTMARADQLQLKMIESAYPEAVGQDFLKKLSIEKSIDLAF